MTTVNENSKKYSEAVKGLKVAQKVADCDVYILELHIRLSKLEELSKTLVEKLNERDEEVKLLKEEAKKLEKSNAQPFNTQAKSWTTFFEKGPSQQKSTEQDMVLMEKIKAESKASAEKLSNIVIIGMNESESEEEADKEDKYKRRKV